MGDRRGEGIRDEWIYVEGSDREMGYTEGFAEEWQYAAGEETVPVEAESPLRGEGNIRVGSISSIVGAVILLLMALAVVLVDRSAFPVLFFLIPLAVLFLVVGIRGMREHKVHKKQLDAEMAMNDVCEADEGEGDAGGQSKTYAAAAPRAGGGAAGAGRAGDAQF